jgi:alpha-glucosidase
MGVAVRIVEIAGLSKHAAADAAATSEVDGAPDEPEAHEPAQQPLAWWQRGVVYQIYPLSFQDTDGDGKGDLPGIAARLDHLSELGVAAVWLAPVHPSPMCDLGYDVEDFQDVDPVFGRLEDLDRLTEALHARGIRLILDFVPNHTSDRHPWFRESRAKRDSPKRDWYVWRDPAPGGGPPNNWLSRFGGSAWELDPRTGQYYYHAFLKEQPDLNWRNPEVRRAMADVLRFWLRRGVDGFRVDAAAVLAEDALLRDDPPNPAFNARTPPPERFRRVYTDARPETLGYLAELRRVVDEFPGSVLLGEVDTSSDLLPEFYGRKQPRLHLPLNYGLLDTRWEARSIADTVQRYLAALPPGAWPCWSIGSHDKPRIASRVGAAQARVAAMLVFTLPGTPVIYAGDEIGMEDAAVAPERARDPFERCVPGYELNRDPSRAPMRWSAGHAGGFTTGEPWLPVGDGKSRCDVAAQRQDARSLLALYRELIAVRAEEAALLTGRHEPAAVQNHVLAYWRCLDGRRLLVALNLGDAPGELRLPGSGEVRLSTHLDRAGERASGSLGLRPAEGVIVTNIGK